MCTDIIIKYKLRQLIYYNARLKYNIAYITIKQQNNRSARKIYTNK